MWVRYLIVIASVCIGGWSSLNQSCRRVFVCRVGCVAPQM